MQHRIDAAKWGPNGRAMASAVGACVHCGFCLPTCPTYRVLEEEMDSPRGRIFLMKEALEEKLSLDEVAPYVDRCLGCLACETSCPSGVAYGELVTPFRALLESSARGAGRGRWWRRTIVGTLARPARFRAAARLGGIGRRWAKFLPPRLRAMLALLPRILPQVRSLPDRVAPIGERRARVALLAGCAQQALAPEINVATLRVLAVNGVEVVVPPDQGCCGALSMHTGFAGDARRAARRNLASFPADVDAIVTNAAGCGSGMREYRQLFAGESEAERAAEFARRVFDVASFLDELGLVPPPPPLARPTTVAYHDACHLGHAQRVVAAPRRLLGAIDGLKLRSPRDPEVCCGSAGIYNLEQPEIAAQLGDAKARALAETGAPVVATGNIGCMAQIRIHLERRRASDVGVLHTMEVLDRAYRRVPLVP